MKWLSKKANFKKANFRKLGENTYDVKAKATVKEYLCNKNSESNSNFGAQQL